MRVRSITPVIALAVLAACSDRPAGVPSVSGPAPIATTRPAPTGAAVAVTDGPFNLPAPADLARLQRKPLWTTAYIAFLADEDPSPAAVELLGPGGAATGLRVSPRSFCLAAIEGTLEVTGAGGRRRSFNFAGLHSRPLTNCRPFVSTATDQEVSNWASTLWSELGPTTPYGTGVTGPCDGRSLQYRLVPHRSLAVDRRQTFVPYGTVLYIPRLRGAPITLPGGRTAAHDGYVFAADTGTSTRIRDNHVDYYKGPATNDRVLPQLTSDAGSLLDAYVVEDAAIVSTLCRLHVPGP